MKKHEYLRDPEVAAFVEWMGANLGADSTRGHGYVLPREQRLWFRNLADAFALYAWRFNFLRLDGRRCSGMSFAESKAVLDVLQAQLRTALEAGDDALVRDAAVEVVRWGGVAPHNEEWLRVNKNGLAALIGRVRVAIGQQDDAADFCPGLRFNAGMTKVYSPMPTCAGTCGPAGSSSNCCKRSVVRLSAPARTPAANWRRRCSCGVTISRSQHRRRCWAQPSYRQPG